MRSQGAAVVDIETASFKELNAFESSV